jgi:hypothetical protein
MDSRLARWNPHRVVAARQQGWVWNSSAPPIQAPTIEACSLFPVPDWGPRSSLGVALQGQSHPGQER